MPFDFSLLFPSYYYHISPVVRMLFRGITSSPQTSHHTPRDIEPYHPLSASFINLLFLAKVSSSSYCPSTPPALVVLLCGIATTNRNGETIESKFALLAKGWKKRWNWLWITATTRSTIIIIINPRPTRQKCRQLACTSSWIHCTSLESSLALLFALGFRRERWKTMATHPLRRA